MVRGLDHGEGAIGLWSDPAWDACPLADCAFALHGSLVQASTHLFGNDGYGLWEVNIDPEPLDRFRLVLETEEFSRFLKTAASASELLDGRIVWNVTSTAKGGGVAEMLASLLPLARGAGINTRWVVLQAREEFFRLTKRIHNRLHGDPGDGGELGPAEHVFYEQALAHTAGLRSLVSARDIVVLHDPQTAGLVPMMHQTGATVIWRCHIGVDVPNALVRSAWDFLVPYLEEADAYVFTRMAYVGEGLSHNKVTIIPPSIDAFSPKNQMMSPEDVDGILAATGLVRGSGTSCTFVRTDGTKGVVTRATELSGGTAIPEDATIVTQISRWDRLKDPVGVMRGFVEYVVPHSDAHLVLAGPAVTGVADDPEGAEVLAQVRALRETFPSHIQSRLHVASLPMADVEENAAIVNALQRRAAIVVQKSLAEGFGLTVAEAMWKERAIVASRVGGIQDQLINGESGLLVDPTDLAAYGRAMVAILSDPELAARLGLAAHVRCRNEYLGPRHLTRYVRLFESLLCS
jgi:trehalose synthase